MLQWFSFLLAVMIFEDEKKHREWQRAQKGE